MATPSIKSGYPLRVGAPGGWGQTITQSVTLAAGNAIAVLAFLDRAGTDFTSMTCGGVSMTAGTSQTNSFGGKVQGFYLSAASLSAGAQNVVLNCTNGDAKPQILIVVIEDTGGGAVTLSNISTVYTGNNTSQSITITSATGSLAMVLTQDDSSSTPTGTSSTTIAYYDAGPPSVGVWTKAGAASVTLSTTYAAPAPSVAKFGFSAASDGGGGGTSSVTSDLTIAYGVAAAVQSDLQISYTIQPQQGTITSEPLKDNTGTLLANTPLAFYAIYNDTTHALVLLKTGISTNSSGVVTFSDPAITQGATYRHDWETTDGKRRMPRKAAT